MPAVVVGALLVVLGLLGLFGPWSALRQAGARRGQLITGYIVSIAFGVFLIVSFLS